MIDFTWRGLHFLGEKRATAEAPGGYLMKVIHQSPKFWVYLYGFDAEPRQSCFNEDPVKALETCLFAEIAELRETLAALEGMPE